MSVRFPQAKDGYQVSDMMFLAAWRLWFTHFGPEGGDPVSGLMPILCEHVVLSEQLKRQRHFSLDVMCRLLSPDPDTAQATIPFRLANQHMLECNRFLRLESGGRSVKAAKLTAQSVRLLGYVDDSLAEVDQARGLLNIIGASAHAALD